MNISALAIATSGIFYFCFRYLMESEDPFSLINHPWQPVALHLHVLASPVFMLTMGIMVSCHVIKKLRNGNGNNHHVRRQTPRNNGHSKEGRRSGWVSLGSVPLMAVSGYLLQVATNEWVLRTLLVLHLVSGMVFAVSYLIHFVVGRWVRKAKVASRHETRLAA